MTVKVSKVDTGVQTKQEQQSHKQITPAVPTIVITPPYSQEPEQSNKSTMQTWMDILKKIQMPHRLS